MASKVEEMSCFGDHTFLVDLSVNDYSELAKIRNAMNNNDEDALASVIERGLKEVANDVIK